MKKKLGVLLILLSVSAFSANFEAGLISPMQLNTPETSVTGVRVGLIHTENADVRGLDLNLISNTKNNFTGLSLGSIYDETRGDFTGVRIPLFGIFSYNRVDGNFTGLQLGGVNTVGKEMKGAQFGVVNLINTGVGFQAAAYNGAESFRGLQLGFVNYTKRLEGVQIGFVNIADNSQIYPVLPIVNFNFYF